VAQQCALADGGLARERRKAARLIVLQTQPWHVEGNRIYGPGIADDKGGIAVILHALQILNDAGWHEYARLTVLFNSDEEIDRAHRAS
jgi:acetylornithine deacetylase/succinyl-diaminopimelate desuccinylase-like protein